VVWVEDEGGNLRLWLKLIANDGQLRIVLRVNVVDFAYLFVGVLHFSSHEIVDEGAFANSCVAQEVYGWVHGFALVIQLESVVNLGELVLEFLYLRVNVVFHSHSFFIIYLVSNISNLYFQ
jgi:hypothetical protein